VFSSEDPYTGVDLDACVAANGRLHPAAAAIIGRLDTYAEISPSRTGLKMIVRAELPDHRGRSTKHTEWGDEIAMYDRARFFTVTGRAITRHRTIPPRQQELDALIAAAFPSLIVPQARVGVPVIAGDSELLARAFAAGNGNKIRALYHGDSSAYGGDRSCADFALATLFAFWTADPDQIERLMRTSELAREKWDRSWGDTTWIRRIILKAGGG
jgi:putative DNA primase/helicase